VSLGYELEAIVVAAAAAAVAVAAAIVDVAGVTMLLLHFERHGTAATSFASGNRQHRRPKLLPFPFGPGQSGQLTYLMHRKRYRKTPTSAATTAITTTSHNNSRRFCLRSSIAAYVQKFRQVSNYTQKKKCHSFFLDQ